MKTSRPVIIVDPLSSGVELAPAFKKRGIPAIAVTSVTPMVQMGFGTKIQVSDFMQVIPNQAGIEKILEKFNPLAILPGAEGGVPLAEHLSAMLTPELSNDPKKAQHRVHKALMQQALAEAGIPALQTISTASEGEVSAWIKEHNLTNCPLIVKPPISAGSDKVFHIPAGGDWKQAFHCVLVEPSRITKKRNETVVVQEQAVGVEYAISTVSANGKHYVTQIIKYNKAESGVRKTIFDHVEFVPLCEKVRGMVEYTKKALDALGIRYGAAHTEVMLTHEGPRLIETGARMIGGPTVGFAREATGSSQADKLVEIYVDGDVKTKEFTFKKTVMPVFLKSPANGFIANVEVLEEVYQLPTFFQKHIWFKNGSRVPKTVDYLTAIGIIALSGERELILSDLKKIRSMESKLMVYE